MRKYSIREIVKLTITRFVITYLILQNIHAMKSQSEAMFTFEKWNKSSWTKKYDGEQAKKKNYSKR